MELGGAERALLGLLYALDTDKVDVDLFINQHTGPFMELIPKNINLLPEIPIYSTIERPMKDILKEGHILIVMLRLWNKLNYHIFKWRNNLANDATGMQFLMDAVAPVLPKLHHLGEYDLAISFIDPPHIVQDKVLAKKKIEWIHTDFSSRQRHYDVPKTIDRWAANDHIMSISDDVTEAFLLAFPTLKDKIIKMENIIPQKLILEQSKQGKATEYEAVENDVVKLCSVGRLTSQKNFDNVPKIAAIMKGKGLKFHWWIVGPGDKNSYVALCKEQGVEDCVTFLGARNNPYPYMRECDIYVQPSRWEGKAVTVQEAQMLARPVLITRYPTSGSQIVDGEDGIICEMDNQSVADTLARMMNDKVLCKRIGEKACEMHPGNNEEVKIIYSLLNEN